MDKELIVNADDLGYAEGINEGIIKAHSSGIVTSTSLMVYGRACEHGIKLAAHYPKLGVGLHFQIENEEWALLRQLKNAVSVARVEKIKQEFLRQVNLFTKLTGGMPDHIDSHHHVHRLPRIRHFIRTYCQEHNLPERGQVNFIDSFFGMPTTKPLTVGNLIKIIKNLPPGISELMCHPGVVSLDLQSSYTFERELELEILTSSRIKQEIQRQRIKLVNWATR